jgi:hypothetical protein
MVELDELLRRSQIVSLHARLSPETNGLIGAKQLAAMPANSAADWLIRMIFEAVDRAPGGISAIAREQVDPGTVQ